MNAGRLRDDAIILWHMARGQSRRGDHASRLQAFYGPQADRYDAFRERLLHGRAELLERLAPTAGARLVELGAGTGRNIEFLGDRLASVDITLVDLCTALVEVARRRTAERPNVQVIEADATRWQPTAPVDYVLMSYALTMIPDWRGVIDNAYRMLRPGGSIAIVDYTIGAAEPRPGRARHSWPMRQFWSRWFGHDGVHLDPAHLDLLTDRFQTVYLSERLGKVPYLLGLSAPYYLFIGQRPSQA